MHHFLRAWRGRLVAAAVIFTGSAVPFPPAHAEFVQEGQKLVGADAANAAGQGSSVGLSADGNAAIVGGPVDFSDKGAAWVFTRGGGAWSQQGSKLVGAGAVGSAEQGFSVALAGDGSTAIVGGPFDSSVTGAAWVFTRSGGVWSQFRDKLTDTSGTGERAQGWSVAISADGSTAIVGAPLDGSGSAWIYVHQFVAGSGYFWIEQAKLVGSDTVGQSVLGASVALSSDGNTAIVGGQGDNSTTGAAWVFTRSGSTWTQQGGKLVGVGAAGGTFFGLSVALSADGDTAIVGGPGEVGGAASPGASWVFTRASGGWTQQGPALVGTGAAGNASQGASVALSADGNTAIVGGPDDNGTSGAAWVFTRTGIIWKQLGAKLVGTGSAGAAHQGSSLALSADGKTAISGGPSDNSSTGAAWVFVRSASHDFNGDGYGDIVWRNTGNNVALWLMNSNAVVGSAALGTVPSSLSIVGQHDFSGDGNADILWRDTNGTISMWLMNGTSVSQAAVIANVPTSFTLAGTGDLNNDGKGDLLWYDTSGGTVSVWFMNGTGVAGTALLGTVPPGSWSIVGDTDGSIFWRDTSGHIALWGVQNGQVATSNGLGTVASNFVVQGLGDFNADGFPDIVWRDTNTGVISIWFTNGQAVTSAGVVSTLPSNWNIAQVGDFNGDGKSDFLLMDAAGDVAMWLMNGTTVSQSLGLSTVGPGWTVQNVNAN